MKRIILAILLISAILLVGCDGEDTTTTAGSGAFIGGTQGIMATFEPFGVVEDGVYSIFDAETIPIEVTLNNKGEYEIQPGDITVELKGPSMDFTGIPSLALKNAGTIETVSELLTIGGEETLTFSSDAKYSQPVNGAIDREWFANFDYNYETYLIVPEVCLKEDLTDDRVCTIDGAKTYFVSGAPITITSVEESTAGKGIMALKIKVSNVGSGKVTKPGDDFGVQERVAYAIDDINWECKQGGKLGEARLINGEAEIICKLKEALPEGTLATKQLGLTISYKYRDIIQETLRIKESVE
ncbi:hypothetical protein HOE37_00415 [Candidatus Woesearchaeota archaeon]|jgi:hypothetical protein|nr:hypothetical protein [Candidatus Woesearchaeota archaeon]MBT4110299.1 hypothetical protein [Candidatus Woesearchaeota archaeon]MBT4336177.1 hypothetical protein [Candidatus Woesearchaeota archaeon]MBT4468844.1 hypothetical protein [Candidatus Woesearchaeota archaeon]MBT6744837.1 hypothetical protein [Candidatus Woesearchaeota archaeon]